MDIRKIDALELLKSLDDKSVDLILTDPPYYKLLKVDWDNQWKTKDDYLNWLEDIVKECQRVLKDNGSLYMFASAEMSWYVESVIRKYFNVLNHIRWADKQSMSSKCNKEELRRYINNSEEIIFAEHIGRDTEDSTNAVYNPIVSYLDTQRKNHNITITKCNQILGKIGIASHYFTNRQHRPITEEAYNQLRGHMNLKPYEEIKQEYEALRRTFKLKADKPHNNTWNFKQTPTRKGRHPCEKPEDLISHMIDVSSNEGDLVVDMFCGSCVVPKCCDKMNRRCIAGDVDDTYF